jgi:hypothetical protein
VAGGSGMWREVASLHGFRASRRLSLRTVPEAFGHGLGTSSGPENRRTQALIATESASRAAQARFS